MKLDLCKMLGVKEEEEFKINNSGYMYKIIDNEIYFKGKNLNWIKSCILLNDIKEIIKLSKKLSDKVIDFIKILDSKWKWLAKDEDGDIYLYTDKPYKNECDYTWDIDGDKEDEDYFYINHLIDDEFNFLSWKDEEPFDITPYK